MPFWLAFTWTQLPSPSGWVAKKSICIYVVYIYIFVCAFILFMIYVYIPVDFDAWERLSYFIFTHHLNGWCLRKRHDTWRLPPSRQSHLGESTNGKLVVWIPGILVSKGIVTWRYQLHPKPPTQSTNLNLFVERGDTKDKKPHKISHQLTSECMYILIFIHIHIHVLNVCLRCILSCTFATLQRFCFLFWKKVSPQILLLFLSSQTLGRFQQIIDPSLALSGMLHGVTFVLNISNLLGLPNKLIVDHQSGGPGGDMKMIWYVCFMYERR